MGKRRAKAYSHGIDATLLTTVAALVAFGLVMVYSSSAVIAGERYHNVYFFAFRQVVWIMAGSVAMIAGMKINYKKWAALSRPGFFVSVVLLAAALFTPLGRSVGGAQRWLKLGPLSFQPSEMAKVVMVLYMASTLHRKYITRQEFNKKLVPPLLLLVLAVILVYQQPDFGTAMFMIIVSAGVFFIGGVKFSHILTAVMVLAPLIVIMLFARPYRRERIMTFLNPNTDIYGSGFQLFHSITALGSGGITGLGMGSGLHKLFYIPEVHTDFVFAVIGQELGFAGTVTVVALFALFAWRGMKIAVTQEEYLGRVIAAGLTFLIVAQAGVNMAVVTGLFPTKGLPLPFLSFGGSSLFFNMFSAGVILNISAGCRKD